MIQQQDIRIEALTEQAQFNACAALQDTVWGYEASDRMSEKVYLLAAHIGGQVLGAYDGDALVGYAMSLPGYRDGKPYFHSHHLAVLPAYRNFGVGRRLKLAQRDDAIARGISLIEWTFDPLEIKNANLNISRLGAIVRRYKTNFYGDSSSPLQGGLPTDRVIAEWWLQSSRVEQILSGEKLCIEPVEEVTVPAEIYEWKASPDLREKALAVQSRNAEALQSAFAEGLVVLSYRRDERGDGIFQLARMNEPQSL